MAISISLAGRPSDSTGEPKGTKGTSNTVKVSDSSSVFGVDSDSDSAGSDSMGSHPLTKRAKTSHKSIIIADGIVRPTSVAEEKKSVVVEYKDLDLSTENLDPALYLYDELESESSNRTGSKDDPSKVVYLGCAPSAPSGAKPEPVKKDSQYMSRLLRTARDRQLERDIAFDKQQLKADLAEGDAVGEVFVTGAYKRQLEERRRFEEERRKKDEEDLKNSGKSVASLHAHMLKSGIASRTNRKS
ncbi:coiled-coil domain-containing 55, putative [Babesia ovis]|uniref:Coiled-coil domain-containing 55, putative n=1 Tax=Babesia ovis TaxID=5869 RepID=A0A9W5WU62_BABOV|nr:coiled-coil domain-containing 55, putative [Babesia ovis]